MDHRTRSHPWCISLSKDRIVSPTFRLKTIVNCLLSSLIIIIQLAYRSSFTRPCKLRWDCTRRNERFSTVGWMDMGSVWTVEVSAFS